MTTTPEIIFGSAAASRRVGLMGIPYDTSASLGWPGARYAPARIREALSWLSQRVHDGAVYDVGARRIVDLSDGALLDWGDVAVAGHDHLLTLGRAKELQLEILRAGAFPLALGGDHAVSLPLLEGFHEHFSGPLGIIQLDAHLDLVDENARQGRHSGSSQMRRALELGRYAPARVVQVGVRGFNYPDQWEYIDAQGIEQITADEVHDMGALAAAERAWELASAGGAQVYLTVDIDVLEACHAPGSGAHESGGLTTHQLTTFVSALVPRVAAMDIVEVNPLKDADFVTCEYAAYLTMMAAVRRLGSEPKP